MMFRAFTRPSAPSLRPARLPNHAGDIAPMRPHPDRLASLLSERAGEVGLETLMRVL